MQLIVAIVLASNVVVVVRLNVMAHSIAIRRASVAYRVAAEHAREFIEKHITLRIVRRKTKEEENGVKRMLNAIENTMKLITEQTLKDIENILVYIVKITLKAFERVIDCPMRGIVICIKSAIRQIAINIESV